MSIEEKLRVLSDRIRTHSAAMLTEEALKTAIVLPFLAALDYDVFNPDEVVPEFCADAVGKKGEKVDYAVRVGGEIRFLVECKPIATNLDKVHLSQLYRYFSVTSAKFAILTNGRSFQFHTDLVAPNRLDERPFLTFDLAEVQAPMLAELKKFAKGDFDVDSILEAAQRLQHMSAIRRAIGEAMEAPPEDLVRLLSSGLYSGKFTAQVKEAFTPMVRAAFREMIRDAVQSRLSSALAETDDVDEVPAAEDEDRIVTTDEEREAYMIVRAIVRDVIKPSRVTLRDQKTYCSILIDDNNRRRLARLWFNRGIKYLGLFDGEDENRVRIESIDQIFDHAEALRATAMQYAPPPGD